MMGMMTLLSKIYNDMKTIEFNPGAERYDLAKVDFITIDDKSAQ